LFFQNIKIFSLLVESLFMLPLELIKLLLRLLQCQLGLSLLLLVYILFSNKTAYFQNHGLTIALYILEFLNYFLDLTLLDGLKLCVLILQCRDLFHLNLNQLCIFNQLKLQSLVSLLNSFLGVSQGSMALVKFTIPLN
jgi:hypothetical protein